MSGKPLLVLIAGIITIATTIFFNISTQTGSISDNANKTFLRGQSQDIAWGGMRLAVRRLEALSTWRTGFPLMNMMGGQVQVTARDTTFNGSAVVQITSMSVLAAGTDNERRDTTTAFYSPGGGAGTSTAQAIVLAAVVTNYHQEPSGGIVIDGRDHDTSGTFIPAASGGLGTLGVWSSSDIQPKSPFSIGGSSGGIDYAPSGTPPSKIYPQKQTYPGGATYPTDPDVAMGGASAGFPSGTLKTVAQSKINGSQYVTSPSKLKYPLSGVTYVELPSGSAEWDNPSIQGSGILIVHNTKGNTIVKNTSASSTFKGLFMADGISTMDSKIIGSMVTLKSGEDELLTGSGTILYSSKVINGLKALTGVSGGGSVSGVVAVWE